MKVVILAGGLGTRISEETHLRPKPMVEIGGYPILWHIMKIYSCHGINDFIICLGYKGYVVKEWFANYQLHMSDVTFDMETGVRTVHRNDSEPWRVTLLDTGEKTQTGGRLARARHLVEEDTSFCLTYGDGLANIDIAQLIKVHRESQLSATITSVQPPGRYGALEISGHQVIDFIEKPRGGQTWISGGFFVMGPQIFSYIDGDGTSLEKDVLPRLAENRQLGVFQHNDFWQPMDTLREKTQLEDLWASGSAPWRMW